MNTIKRFCQPKFILATLLLAVLVLTSVGPHNVVAAGTGPCDIYSSGGTPCVAAHSTVRALYGSYNGNLYQVRRSSDNTTRDIGVLSAGGIANAAAQDSFCSGTSCVITIIYDQSGRGNHLTVAPAGGAGGADTPSNATAAPITINGNKAYGVFIAAGNGYRDNTTSGIATGDQPEGMYAIFDGTHFNGGCCFDYGNAETNNLDNGNGHMEAIYFGNIRVWTFGAGNGPWVMADLENGLFGCAASPNGSLCSNDPTVNFRYTTAIIKGQPNNFAIRAGNAQSGGLSTFYNGGRPNVSGYNPMHKEGAIILGIGGDNSKQAVGTFYEGAMTSGYPSDATENSVQANIVAAGYGSSGGPTPTPPPAQQNPITLYPFDGNANDTSGNGLNATLVNGPTFTTGRINQAVSLNGSNQSVSLPTGIVSNLGDFSIATWVFLNSSSGWNRIFDFGTGTTVNMFLTPQNGSTNAVRFAITTSGNGAEQQITGSSALPTGVWTHVAVTKSGNTGTLYVNGSVVGTNNNMTLSPSSLGSTNQNWLGRSQYSADPFLNGRIDDFRIYNRALSASEVSSLASGGGPTPTPPPGTTTIQAESAAFGGGTTIDTNHTGYNGTGFANFPTSGGFVEFQNVNGGTGGSHTLTFRFALGATSARTGLLIINGVSQNITFSPTGSWDTWATQTVTITLNSGTGNTIRLQSNGSDLANLDQMTVN
ncbi:MAG TPA: arabinofuranosidase catalytic domain-containing protein [Anaerolineales bacterium]|nr:arabinofuranosidase catalytic domain-containing protein [Anaerolineales bacterium]